MPGDVDAAQPLRQLLRQERHLHALREAQLLLVARLVALDRLDQPRILNRHRGFRRQQRQQLDVLLVERVGLGALEVEHANAAILQQQRHDQLGADAGHRGDVARILGDVRHQHHFLVQRRIADQAFADLDGLQRPRIVAEFDRHLQLEGLRVFVEQRDAEDAVVDDALDQVSEPRQQLVRIENRAHLAADLGQRFEGLDVLALGLEQPGGRNRLGDVRAELPQDPLVALGERAEPVAQQVERADHLALVAQRHGQLRLGAGDDRQVARILVDVVEQDRPLFGDRGPDRALADLQREVLDDLLRVADRVGDAQLLALLVEQIHGEHREIGEPGNQVGDFLEQIAEIQHRADLAGQFRKDRQELRVRSSRRS
jgi:hypothetical protein